MFPPQGGSVRIVQDWLFVKAIGAILLIGTFLLGVSPSAEAQAYKFFSFPAPTAGYGAFPTGPLVQDYTGNFYGPTGGDGSHYFGTVFEVTTSGNRIVLHKFEDQGDGAGPLGTLVLDSAGNLFGEESGAHGFDECGLVFKIDPLGNTSVIYTFQCATDGESPQGGLIEDAAGNLYGTTQWGGTGPCQASGCGTVFRIDSAGNKTIVYSFQGGTDGIYPEASLVEDSEDNLYGTTEVGGTGSACTSFEGCGTVFKIDPAGYETVLYSFQGGSDGALPYSNLILDRKGNLYGTTSEGGQNDAGTVFKIDPSGNETVIYRFTGGADGGWPMAGLVMDRAGNLYGTTSVGGEIPCVNEFFNNGCGTIFEVDQAGNLTTLHTFDEGDGASSSTGLLRGASGVLYGDTLYGGSGGCHSYKTQIGCGVIFRLRR